MNKYRVGICSSCEYVVFKENTSETECSNPAFEDIIPNGDAEKWGKEILCPFWKSTYKLHNDGIPYAWDEISEKEAEILLRECWDETSEQEATIK